jgi:hypothetical protein
MYGNAQTAARSAAPARNAMTAIKEIDSIIRNLKHPCVISPIRQLPELRSFARF